MTLLIVSAMLVIPSTTSQPAGIEGIGSGGCNCHGASPDSRVSVALEGVPESYNYSETYNLTISFSGGPTSPENMNQGGFHLYTSHGELGVIDGAAQVWNSNELSHTEAGNDQTSWEVTWKAPKQIVMLNSFYMLIQ